jgi:hypothetical protein
MGRIFQGTTKHGKRRESNENDQEETRTERRAIGEGEEVNMPTHEEIEKCIQKQRIIKHQKKTV